jgi:general stress protein YciG
VERGHVRSGQPFFHVSGGDINLQIGDKPMAGTKAGGKAAAATNKAKYGADFYAKIGAQGGKKGHTGGFYANRELARIAGARGGRISRRVKVS